MDLLLVNPDAFWLIVLGLVQGLYLGFWLGWYKCTRDDVKRAEKECDRLKRKIESLHK